MEIYNIFLGIPFGLIDSLPLSLFTHSFLFYCSLASIKTPPLAYKEIITAIAFFLPSRAKEASYNAIGVLLLYIALRCTFGFAYSV